MTTYARLEMTGVQSELNVRDTEVEMMFARLLSEGEGVQVTAASPSRFIASFTYITPDELAKRINDRLLSHRDDNDPAWRQWAYICAESIASGSDEIHIDIPQSTVVLFEDDLPGLARVVLPSVFEGADFSARDISVAHTQDWEHCVVQDGEILSISEQYVIFTFDEDSPLAEYPVGTILKRLTWCVSVYRDGELESVVSSRSLAFKVSSKKR